MERNLEYQFFLPNIMRFWYELPDGQHRPVKDAADWIADGGTLAEINALMTDAPRWDYNPDQDDRAESSRENGEKGGRPRNEYADAADLFADARLRDGAGRLTLRCWHGSWFAFRDNGWSEISEAGYPLNASSYNM